MRSLITVLMTTLVATFTLGSNDLSAAVYTVTCDGGTWQSEVSWTLLDSNGTSQLIGGSPYSSSEELADGDYVLDMQDSYGDGWNGDVWTVSDSSGAEQASCTITSGTSGQCTFALPLQT